MVDSLHELLEEKDKQNRILVGKLKAALQNKQDYEILVMSKNKRISELTGELSKKQEFIITCLESQEHRNRSPKK